jgi:hypothetical protein
MIVFGGIDGNDNLQNDVLLDTNANGSGGLFRGDVVRVEPELPAPAAAHFP